MTDEHKSDLEVASEPVNFRPFEQPEGVAHPPQKSRENPKRPKPLTIFTARPPHYWHAFNAERALRRRNATVEWRNRVIANRPRKGWPSLKEISGHHRPLFAKVPRRLKAVARAELTRLLNKYLIEHGHSPSPQKYASLCANASFIALYCATGKKSRQMKSNEQQLRNWKRIVREDALRQMPPEVKAATAPPRARSSYRLPGV